MILKATDITIETVSLEEIHDLEWPTDPALVTSFRKTLQQGGHFSPIRLNRVWLEDATWRYEIIDGFHRFEASRAENMEALVCQVEELSERAARYERIRACIGKPSEVTIQRAQRELKGAFIEDVLAHVGHPDPLYEPVLGEDGQVHARRRHVALPSEPLQALEVLTDHLIVTTLTSHPHTSLHSLAERPFGPRAGWEKVITEWIEEMSQRWGYNTYWLLDVLHVQALVEAEPGNRMSRREAQLLWQIPDVDVRNWFHRQFQLQPRSDLVEKIIASFGFSYHVIGGGVREGGQTPKKSEIQQLLSRYPSLTELSAYLEARRIPTPPTQQERPGSQHEGPAQDSHDVITPAASAPAVFALASPGFVVGTSQLPPSLSSVSPTLVPHPPDKAIVYRPFHDACLALLRAAHTLTQQYGTEWLQWEPAQADLAQVRALLQWE